jgi:hypothetical protein
VENTPDHRFAFTVGSIRASDDHTFDTACSRTRECCDALRGSTAAAPLGASYLASGASGTCSACGKTGHTAKECYRGSRSRPKSSRTCRNYTSSPRRDCAFDPCPYKHPSPVSHLAVEERLKRLPSPPGPDAFSGQYSFYSAGALDATQDAAPPPAYKNAETAHQENGHTAPTSSPPLKIHMTLQLAALLGMLCACCVILLVT